MKKNKMMRTAAVLGVATLLTTCALSGTLAKYTTTASGGDSARVAKWNITMGNNGSGTFTDTYDTTVKGIDSDSNGADVVAPGTHGSATYYVDGAPETAYEITFDGKMQDDVFLAKDLNFKYSATKTDFTDASYSKPGSETEGKVDESYYPVNYSIKISQTQNGGNGGNISAIASGQDSIKVLGTEQTFETLDAAMKALSNTKITYSTPNTEAGLTVEFKWAWAFDESDDNAIKITSSEDANGTVTSNDVYDTVLGDISAKNKDLTVNTTIGTALEAKSGNLYDTTIGYTLAITATQID